jgi:hypothetical protein
MQRKAGLGSRSKGGGGGRGGHQGAGAREKVPAALPHCRKTPRQCAEHGCWASRVHSHGMVRVRRERGAEKGAQAPARGASAAAPQVAARQHTGAGALWCGPAAGGFCMLVLKRPDCGHVPR